MSSRQRLLDILYSFLGRCSWGEDLADAELLEFGDVFFGDGSADEDEDVLGLVLFEELDYAGDERHVGAREDGDADGVGVLLDGRFHDLFWGLVEARVDDLHPRVAEGAGDDLGPPVVPVEADLRDNHPYRARHSYPILTTVMASCAILAHFSRSALQLSLSRVLAD